MDFPTRTNLFCRTSTLSQRCTFRIGAIGLSDAATSMNVAPSGIFPTATTIASARWTGIGLAMEARRYFCQARRYSGLSGGPDPKPAAIFWSGRAFRTLKGRCNGRYGLLALAARQAFWPCLKPGTDAAGAELLAVP